MSRSDHLKSEQPEFDCTFFLDRTHGKSMGRLLRKVGFSVKSIYEVFPKRKHETTSDPTWLEKCSSEGWIVISGDKRLDTDPKNRAAVIATKCKVCLLTD